jgi:LmbE family N-acetylglucosaminyl deacetylase
VVAFRVAEDSTGTSEERWRGAFSHRVVPSLTREALGRPVVAVSAHPDDDVLAVGDLLRGCQAAGGSIRSMVATDGERSHGPSEWPSPTALGRVRRSELRRAYHLLGLSPSVRWLRVPDGDLAGHEIEVRRRIRPMLEPETIVLAPWRFDGHPDHEAAGRAAADAAAESGATLWEYPVWAWHWADPDDSAFPWNRARRWVCDDPVRKQRAIDCFVSQVRSAAGSRTDGPVLPAAVLARFHRPFEVVFA